MTLEDVRREHGRARRKTLGSMRRVGRTSN
jgi:hypothetical protein